MVFINYLSNANLWLHTTCAAQIGPAAAIFQPLTDSLTKFAGFVKTKATLDQEHISYPTNSAFQPDYRNGNGSNLDVDARCYYQGARKVGN